MYASVSTVQLQPQHVATFTQRWIEQSEPVANQISTLVDLYVLLNPETHTVVVFGIFASEADAVACQASAEYQQLFGPSVDLVVIETFTHTGYIVIST